MREDEMMGCKMFFVEDFSSRAALADGFSSRLLLNQRSAVQHFRVLARMTPALKEELATLLMEAGKTVLM